MKNGDLENAFFNAYLYDKLALSSGRALNLVEADLIEFTTQMKIYPGNNLQNVLAPLAVCAQHDSQIGTGSTNLVRRHYELRRNDEASDRDEPCTCRM